MTYKDSQFNETNLNLLATRIKQVFPQFKAQEFRLEALKIIEEKELMKCMTSVGVLLKEYLTGDFEKNRQILLSAFKNAEPGGFIYGSMLHVIVLEGCQEPYIEKALDTLADLTHIFTAEFAVRPFLEYDPDRTIKKMIEFAQSNNLHKRRLASEGTRPNLPWSGKTTLDYHKTRPILDMLFQDHERYVTHSVANHLNDISKIDLFYVLNILKEWRKKLSSPPDLDYIEKHALRTAIKNKQKEAFEYLGYPQNVPISTVDLVLAKGTLNIGETLTFRLNLFITKPTNLVVDYAITYPTKLSTSKKVYKWKTIKNAHGEIILNGKREFKQLSTRTIRPGIHEISVQINGKTVVKKQFNITSGQ
jgi:3-methyladenine DNA glycosylase AlkC